MIERYLKSVYKDGARGEIIDGKIHHDCWSLTRTARVELYGRPLLPSRGGEYQRDPKGFTRHYREQIADMNELTEPVPGAVIAVIKKRVVCIHVALVVHDINQTGLGLHVLEINPDGGARIIPLYRFMEWYSNREIEFYDDQDLPEPTQERAAGNP